TERKKAEEALYEGQQVFRILVECSPDIIARYDLDCKRTYVNPVYLKEAQIAQEELLSSSPMQISPLPTDSAVALQYLLRTVLSSGVAEAIDVIWPKADNIDYWYNIFAFPEFDREGNVVSVMTISRDITVHKRIEEERVAKLRYFENIDTFNKIIQEGTDVEQMMKNVLDSVLRIFDCDRAFLMYPCDPASDFWKVPMESCKPEYPGVLQLGLEIPMDAGVAESLRILLDSNRPVKFGPGTEYPLPAEISEQFGFKCFMSMAIYPKVGKPWQFGIHQCSYARNWTPDEERLLKEIGWRFADAITNLMVFRDLQQSEKKFHRIVDTANEGIWLLGPDHLTTFVNARMTEIIGYSLEELVGKPVSDFMFDEDVPDYQNNLLTRFQGLPDTFESRLLHKDGRTIWVNVATTPVSDGGESFSGSFAMLTDITNRKHAESQILKLNRIYSVLSNINQTIVRIHEPEEMLEAACQIAVEYGGFLMAWIGMVDFGTNRVVTTASHGIVGDYLKQINIDLADEARSNGPTGIAIKTGRHKISNNIEDDESMILWRDSAITYGYKSSAAFPIIVYGKIVGAFNIYSGETGFFEEDDIKLLDEMAIDISFALEYIESESMRNQAEAELQKSEERYRLIAENTADTITVFDLNLNITYISPSVFKLRGFTPDEAAAQSLDKMLTPGSLQKAIPVFTNEMTLEAKATEDITRTTLLELEEYCKDGSTIWVEISVSILRDTTLKPTGLLTVTRDISQRKLLEFQLRNSEQEFRSLAESSPDIIIRYNLDCRAIYANQRFFKTVPADPQSFIGKTPIESYPTVMEEYQAKLQKVIETGVPEYLELQLADVNGNTITHYVCFVAELDNDGKRIGALAIGRDITELRQSEEKVKQLSRAVEQSPVSILITDSDGRIQYLNKKITEITGYYPEELIGKTPRIFSSGEHPAEKYKELWETVSSGNEWRGEFHNKKKSGELFWELASISPIKDESGKCTQYLAVKEDITAKKELENNLISAKERAELANKLKDAFIANISHEIRTPLNGIVGMTSIIRDLYSKYIKEDEEHYFASISRSSRRLMISVDKILNFSRLQIGDFPLKLSRVSIAAVLEAVVTEYQKYSQEKSLQLIFNSAVEDDKVFVDETAIETAFAVIVENAIKFTEAGTVTIELYRDASNYLCVEVRDTGIGISDDYLSHLFEPYTQEFTGYSRPFEGVGLGLSIAKKLFDLNKACIEVSSKKGKGSIFKVCFKYQEEILPKLNIEAQENKPKQTPSPTKPHIKAGTNILVVEDDAINQIFIKSILKKDYQIVLAADADKAFKFFQNQQFDLILMDISLKHGMNGLELTRLIRSGARNSAVPIIAVTGHAFPTDRQNALESGCTDYLSKPFEPEDLLEKVKLYI
ncbi:MAG: PAS domain S-box protein, partial [Ignavibacteriales bacterium]|nr:PAS domain S-box protein [Ignavibacteriales bacterium]